MKVHWKAASVKGALPVDRYEVRLVAKHRPTKVVTVDDAVRAKLIAKLGRKVAYSVTVRAHNWTGWGAWSTVRKARTR